eukprot:COSAG02_NODE_7459_length_3004_cov_2.064028_4_plen_73_part_00
MNQILEAVQTTFELQQEVNNALGELSVRSCFKLGNTLRLLVRRRLLMLLMLLHRDTWGSATQQATAMPLALT